MKDVVQVQKISVLPPTEGIGNSWTGGWGLRDPKFKAMYEAELEFPGGWWGFREDAFHSWDIDIFWNYTFT